jgi:aminopeptidase-like protein
MLWVLNGSDGTQTLLDIAERADLPFSAIEDAAEPLVKVGLLKECPAGVT